MFVKSECENVLRSHPHISTIVTINCVLSSVFYDPLPLYHSAGGVVGVGLMICSGATLVTYCLLWHPGLKWFLKDFFYVKKMCCIFSIITSLLSTYFLKYIFSQTYFFLLQVIRQKFSVRNFWKDCIKYECNVSDHRLMIMIIIV